MKYYDRSGELILNTDSPAELYFQRGKLNLDNVNLSQQILEGIFFDECLLNRADFSHSRLYGAYFLDAKANDSIFDEADLRGTRFDGASLIRASFISANLGCDANETATSMQKADLRGADFTGAFMEGVILAGSIYDSSTKFPKGVRPAEMGLLYISE